MYHKNYADNVTYVCSADLIRPNQKLLNVSALPCSD